LDELQHILHKACTNSQQRQESKKQTHQSGKKKLKKEKETEAENTSDLIIIADEEDVFEFLHEGEKDIYTLFVSQLGDVMLSNELKSNIAECQTESQKIVIAEMVGRGMLSPDNAEDMTEEQLMMFL